jgi:hypothetical protein
MPEVSKQEFEAAATAGSRAVAPFQVGMSDCAKARE